MLEKNDSKSLNYSGKSKLLEANWSEITSLVNTSSLSGLLSSLQMTLLSFKPLNESYGSINKIYVVRVQMKSHRTPRSLILRITNPRMGTHRTETEVLAMDYFRNHTSMPVPDVYSYSNNRFKSRLGCEYILMERMPGIVLHDYLVEYTFTESQLSLLVEQMAEFIRQMREVPPPSADDDIVSSCSSRSSNESDTNAEEEDDNGDDDEDIYQTVNVSLVNIFTRLKQECRRFNSYLYLADRVELLRRALKTLVEKNDYVDKLRFNDKKVFSHGDLNAGNILIDPYTHKITAILDWEFVSYGYDDKSFDSILGWFIHSNSTSETTTKAHLIKMIQKNFSAKGLKETRGKVVRNYIEELIDVAETLLAGDQTGVSSLSTSTSVNTPSAKYFRFHAERLNKLLDRWPKLMDQVKNEE